MNFTATALLLIDAQREATRRGRPYAAKPELRRILREAAMPQVHLATAAPVVAPPAKPPSADHDVLLLAYLDALIAADDGDPEADGVAHEIWGMLNPDEHVGHDTMTTLSSMPEGIHAVSLNDGSMWERFIDPDEGDGWRNTALGQTWFAWTPFTTRRQTQGAVNETGRKLYGARAKRALESQGTRQGRQDSGVKAIDIASRIASHRAGNGAEAPTEQDYKDLLDHLPALTRDKLANLRRLLGASFGREGRQKFAMAKALTEHLKKQIAASQPKTGEAPAPEAAAAAPEAQQQAEPEEQPAPAEQAAPAQAEAAPAAPATEPEAETPPPAPALPPLTDKLRQSTAHLDKEHVLGLKKIHEESDVEHDHRVDTLTRMRDQAKDELRNAGKDRGKQRQAQKKINDLTKLLDEAVEKRGRHANSDDRYTNHLQALALDETQPEFVRHAAAIKSKGGNPDDAYEDIRGHVAEHLKANGNDPEIADAVAAQIAQYPLHGLDRHIQGETNRANLVRSRKEAADFIDTLPHLSENDRSVGKTSASQMYASDIERFKEDWHGRNEASGAAKIRKAEEDARIKAKQEEHAKRTTAAKEYTNAVQSGHSIPKVDSDTLAHAVRESLDAGTQWQAGDDLPKAPTEKMMVRQAISDGGGSKYALAKTITEQGWLTDTRYLVKATPAMVEAAKKANVGSFEGRTPNIQAIIPKTNAGETATIKGTREDPNNGWHLALLESDDGKHQVLIQSKYAANILKLYPGAKIRIDPRKNHAYFVKDGEVVGMVVGIDQGKDKKKIVPSTDKALGIGEMLAKGPYSEQDVQQAGDRLVVGSGPSMAYVRLTGNDKSGYSIPEYTDRSYLTRSAAVAAAKQLLAHAHGMDENNHLIFKPVGETTELQGDEKQRTDYYKDLRERAAKAKPIRKEKVTVTGEDNKEYERERLHLTDEFAIQKAAPDKKGRDTGGWTVIHTPTGLRAGGWTTQAAAKGHALALAGSNAIDWKNLNPEEMKANDPEGFKATMQKFNNITKAYENDEYHPDMGGGQQQAAQPQAEAAPSAPEAAAPQPADQMPGGKADAVPPESFDPASVAQGIKVEAEHTNDPAKAAEIARDHLAEDPNYYEKLKAVEGEPGGRTAGASAPANPHEASVQAVTPAKVPVDEAMAHTERQFEEKKAAAEPAKTKKAKPRKAASAEPVDATEHTARLKAALEKAKTSAQMSPEEVEATLADLKPLDTAALWMAANEAGIANPGKSKAEITKRIRSLLEAGRKTMEQTAH